MAFPTNARRHALLLAALAGTAAAGAAAKEVAVMLAESDQHALRAVSGKRADGTPLAGVLDITGYDAGTKTFVISTVRQRGEQLAASDLKELTFQQTPRSSAPQAQTCAWDTSATKGAVATVKLRGDALRIGERRLLLDDAAFAAPLAAGSVLEAQRIAYDSAADVFTVSLQPVRYETKMQPCGGTGGSSSPGKALQ